MTKRLLLIGLFLTLLCTATDARRRTVRTLCASGCTATLTEANLQAQINAAAGGDEILLQAGTTTDVALTLPAHTGASMVTIRTGVTSTGSIISAGSLPPANVRIAPATATSFNLATLRAKNNNTPAIVTSSAIGGNGWWTLKDLVVTSNTFGGEALIQLGSDSNISGEQDSIARIPTNFTVERVYVKGDPVSGQFRGIRAHVNNFTLKDSRIDNIKSITEGQALWGNSFSTGWTISNNYIEGGTEVVFFGGSGGCCHPDVTVASATSASSFTLSGRTDLFVGRAISVFMASTAVEEWTYVTACGTSTDDAACTSNTITVSPALSGTPAVGADVDWGPIPSDVIFEKNYVTRNPAMRNAIVATPQTIEASAFDTGGTLGVGTYAYRVVARHPFAVNTTVRSAASTEVSAVVDSATGSVVIRWSPVPNADTYYIYGRNAGAQNIRWSVTTSACTGSPVVCSYTDTGSAGTTESVPTSAGSIALVKNIFEIKNGRRFTINGNIFEYSWKDAQTGYAIVFTPANTGDGNDSTTLENVTFTNNIVRSATGFMQIMGRAAGTNGGGSGRAKNITVQNNLAYDLGSQWGSSDRTFIITTNGPKTFYPNNTISNGPGNVTINHNTFVQTSGNAMVYMDLFKTTEQPADNFIWNNNIGYKLTYGFTGSNSCTQGAGCFTAHTAGSTSWQNNVVVDATCSAYPGGTGENFCPTSTAVQNEFSNFAGKDFSLKSTSAYKNAGSDGADIGANMASITALTNIATSGDNTGAPIVLPPTISTSTLPNGEKAKAYTQTITGVCPVTPCTWSLSGSAPTGLTLTQNSNTQATLAGTPSVGGAYAFTVNLAHTGSPTASQNYTVTITDVIQIIDDRPNRFNLDEAVTFRRATDPCTDGEPVRVGDFWGDTSTNPPVIKILAATAPNCSWSAIAQTSGAGTTFLFVTQSSNFSWTMPSTAGQFSSSNDLLVDLTGRVECRMFARTAQVADGKFWVRFSTNLDVTTTDLGTTSQTPQVDLSGSPVGNILWGPWTPIVESSKTFVRLGWWGISPSGATNGTIRNVGLLCR